ncbi:MAG: hypothetical protein PHD82_06545 [Candidatus Riflebacteria bacterium]|jgi:hypothetical protein|nr:hypothetical protein [Candidatus Riflebacteria bacterium]
MNSLRSITRKIDAMLLMIIAGLILSLAISYNYYQSRKTTIIENEELAANLLAYGLPGEAAQLLEENIRRQPLSDRSIKLRQSLVDIYMNEMNDYSKALSELVFLKTLNSPQVASSSEEKIRYCLNRLGRVYDAERSRMLADGINPLAGNVASNTVVRLGNHHAISVDQLRQQLNSMQIPEKSLTREVIDQTISAMTQELLLARAAEREEFKKDPEFIARVRKFENSLAISTYLNRQIFKDRKLDEKQQQELLAEEINRLAQAEAMQINRDVIDSAFPALASSTPNPSVPQPGN